MSEKIVIVEDEIGHQESFREFVELAYKQKGRVVKIVVTGTVMEALMHVQNATIISLDANFPNDLEGSQKQPWQEVIDSVKDTTSVLIYPASTEDDNNDAIEKYCENIPGITVIKPNGKRSKLLYDYIMGNRFN